MILRIPILSPLNTGSPDYNICGQASSGVSWTNLNTIITVNGTDVINIADLSAFTFGTGLNIACGSFTVEDILAETGDILHLKIAFPSSSPLNIQEQVGVRVRASKTGYIAYDKTYTIYDYDLGNNTNVGVTTNIPFNVYLVASANNVVSSVQTKAFSAFNYIPKPFTKSVYVYNAVSNGVEWTGSIQYLDEDSKVILSADGVINTQQTPKIKQKNTLANTTDCSTALVTLPDYSFKITPVLSHNGVEPISSIDTVEVYTDLSGINFAGNTVRRNDALLGSPFKSATITYQLRDIDNNIVDTKVVTLTASGSPSTFTYVKENGTNSFAFSPTTSGDYKVEVEFSPLIYDVSEADTVVAYNIQDELTIAGTFLFAITATSCKVFTIKNYFSDAFTVTISALNNYKQWVEVNEIVLNAAEEKEITVEGDNIYKFSTDVSGVNYFYIVPSFCSIEDCILTSINTILKTTNKASCCDSCSDLKEELNIFNFNAIIMSLDIYTSLIQNYGVNYIFKNELVNLDDLWTINQIISRINEYCKDCNCGCS
jgi:hypothetical protein